MSDNIDNAISAAIRAMEDVITPTIDPKHPLAAEQAELVTNTLKLLEAQLPYRMAKATRELTETIRMSTSLLPLTKWSPAIFERLHRAIETGQAILRSGTIDQSQVNEVARSISGCVCALVRAARIAQVTEQSAIERIVLRSSETLIMDELAWFGPQGWTTSQSLPEIEQRFATN
ncbi:hypothetical protein ACWEK5_08565 [Rhodococcus koreensis]